MILTPAQKLIAQDTHRFRVLCCGRRFGKTTLSVEEIKALALYKNAKIAYLAPTLQQARDIAWEMLNTELGGMKEQGGLIRWRHDTRLEIRMMNMVKVIDPWTKKEKNGESTIVLRGWEAVQTLRGQAFDLIILDEVRDMRNFQSSWEQILIPTLTDRRGKAIFISTPAGFDHFYELFGLEATNDNWKSFKFTTYDNPHIPVDEIDNLKESMNEDAFAQEYMADFRKKTGLVFKDFDRQIHVKKFEVDPKYPIVCGQDFGYTHPAAVLFTYFDDKDNLYVFDEYYETQKLVSEQVGMIKAKRAQYENPLDAVYGDSEAPEQIRQFADAYWYITPVKKTKGSIKLGIDKIGERLKNKDVEYLPKIIIHPRCENFIYELERYSYADKKAGETASNEIPAESLDHLIDDARYVLLNHSKEKFVKRDTVKYRYIPHGGYK